VILLDTRAKLYGLLAGDTGQAGQTPDQAGEAPSSPDASDQ
jgi:hypothetical protein